LRGSYLLLRLLLQPLLILHTPTLDVQIALGAGALGILRQVLGTQPHVLREADIEAVYSERVSENEY